MSDLLIAIDQKINFDYDKKCRFGMFIRLAPGYVSHFPGQVRTWYYRGDKFTTEESKMLRNLLYMIKKRIKEYDRIELYDNTKVENKIVVKITDGVVEINQLQRYREMLNGYSLPIFLKT